MILIGIYKYKLSNNLINYHSTDTTPPSFLFLSHISLRVVYGLIWVGFVSNLQLTKLDRVEEFQTYSR